jgi:citrate lyase subunit beta/citryl-CoA lyase
MSVTPARRSALILPINVPKFVERAHLRNADAIVLDLEDSVVPVYKRALVILARARSVAETERRKADALARLG